MTPAGRSAGVRVGVDLAAVAEVAVALSRYGARYTRRVFTPAELDDTAGPAQASGLAARFAAKEAALKALGPDGCVPGWRDFEVRRGRGGAPELVLHGAAARLAADAGLGPFSLSMSHEGGVAVAVVIASQHGRKAEVAGDEGPLDL